jgi:hypothetical protein
MTEDIDEFHPAAGFDENERAPQIAMIAAIAILPMPDYDDVNVDKDRKN